MEENKKTKPNERLLKIFDEMRENNTPEVKNKMIDEIVMRAKFLVPVIIEKADGTPAEGSGVVHKDDKIKFYTITNTEKQKFLLGFTDIPEIAKWRKTNDQQTLVFGFDEFANLLERTGDVHTGWVIDPYGANVVLPTKLVLALAAEKKVRLEKAKAQTTASASSIPAGTQIRLAEPKNYPIAMVKAMTKYFKSQDCVKSAYLRLMEKEAKISYLIVVDSENEDTAIFDGAIAAGAEQSGEFPLEFVWKSTDFGKNAANGVTPFYIK